MATIEEFAPAKVNLCLHVTGQRPDGYHLLESLVVFAEIGDRLCVRNADSLSLTIDGSEATDLTTGPDNLVLQAARLLSPNNGAAITLTKNLPVASGIGGGSADAAATLRALSRLWRRPLPPTSSLLSLGADIVVCVRGVSCRMSGIGETIVPVNGLPAMDIVLVNPRVPISTPTVFGGLKMKTNPPMPTLLPRWLDLMDFCAWLGAQRNDLQQPALAQAPVIGDVLDALNTAGSLFSAMSGSGATCFGIFPPDGVPANAATAALQARHPHWWCANGRVL